MLLAAITRARWVGGLRHQQAARHIAQQDGDEGAHLHHAVATREFARVQHDRQVGVLDRTEQRGVQAHQEDAQQQDGHVGREKTPGRGQHDEHFQVLDETDHGALLVPVAELAAGGGKQQEGQDEQRADDQPRLDRRQPAHLELVGHQHREGELEKVVVGRAGELGPEEWPEPALAQQGELPAHGLRRGPSRLATG
jgi:hypothetical protein